MAWVATVVADRLSDRQDVGFGEGAAQRRAAVSAGAEADELVGVSYVGPALVILALEPGGVDEYLLRGGLSRERRN